MTLHLRLSMAVLAATLMGFPLALETAASSSQQPQTPLPIFSPVIPQLASVRIPVYLPSWLPSRLLHGQKGAVVAYAQSTGYEVGLSNQRLNGQWVACNACLSFFIDGGALSAPPHNVAGQFGQHVRIVGIQPGVRGYRVETSGSVGEYFQWNIGNHTYTIRLPSPVTDAQYARVARTVAPLRRGAPRAGAKTLASVALRLSDLRRGYKQVAAGYFMGDGAATGYHLPRAAYNPAGASASYTSAFSLDGFPDLRTVDDSVSSFATIDASHRAYVSNVAATQRWYHRAWTGSGFTGRDYWHRVSHSVIGDESTVWSIRIRTPDFTYSVAFAFFRRGRYLAGVRVFTLTVNPLPGASGLASLMNQRIAGGAWQTTSTAASCKPVPVISQPVAKLARRS